VTFVGQRLDTLATDRIVRLGIAQSPEGRRIFPRMTVLENPRARRVRAQGPLAIAPDLERVFKLFPRLAERTAQPGGTLSGGEQQMLAIGRALMARPTLLLLDEPSMGLAPILVEAIFRIVQDINRQGTTILLVEQNARMALSVAHARLRDADRTHRAPSLGRRAVAIGPGAEDLPRREVAAPGSARQQSRLAPAVVERDLAAPPFAE
jgi:branched-chain amino acid transport system ATP-binding protein